MRKMVVFVSAVDRQRVEYRQLASDICNGLNYHGVYSMGQRAFQKNYTILRKLAEQQVPIVAMNLTTANLLVNNRIPFVPIIFLNPQEKGLEELPAVDSLLQHIKQEVKQFTKEQ